MAVMFPFHCVVVFFVVGCMFVIVLVADWQFYLESSLMIF